jgi:hypothetical protein
VAETEVTDAVKGSPTGEVAFVMATVAPVSKPVPVMVTVVAAVPSQIPVGEIAVIVGAALTFKTPASAVEVPLSSVKVTLYEPAAVVACVVVTVAVPVVELVSLTLVKETPVAPTAVRLTGPPSSAKPLPVKETVPEPPAPIAAGVVVKPLRVGAVSAPASVAIARGNAAAASKAPAASALTKWRCIRRGLFIVNCSIHKGRLSGL